MQRHDESRRPEKMRRRSRSGARKAPAKAESANHSPEQFDQLKCERDEALQQQIATSEVLSIIRRSPADAQPVFDAIVESAARLCGAIFSVVYLCEDDHVRIVATKNFTPEAATQLNKLQQLKRPDRSHLSGRAILDRAIVHVPDVLNDPEYSREFALAGGWRAVLAVPLLRDGIPVGALSVAKTEPKPFSDRQIQLLQTFADQALIAIENVRLFEAEQQRTRELSEALEQQTATSEVLKVISSSPGELKPVFEAMLANATRICEAEYGSMFRYQNGAFHPAAVSAPQALVEFIWHRGSFEPPAGTPLDRLLQTEDVVHTSDASTSLPSSPSRIGGARSLIAVPMLKENKLIGAIVIYRQQVKPFTDKQIELVRNFAAQAVIAIENTRLLNELRESLQQQTATSEVLSVISSSPGDLKPVFEAILANATQICDAKFGILALSEGDAFRTAALHGAPPAFAEARPPGTVIRPGPGTGFHRAATTRQPVQIADIRAEPAYTNSPQRYAVLDLAGARTLLAVPMLKEGKLVGMIDIYRQEVRPFTDKQIELVQNFAAQAVIAIENTRLLNELRESLAQQTATADVLKVISSSTGDLGPVFEAMLANAVRICEAKFGVMWRFDGEENYPVAMLNLPPSVDAFLRQRGRRKPTPGSDLDVLRTSKQSVHTLDMAASSHPTRIAKSAGVRTQLAVPLLLDTELVGAITIYRQEVRPFTEKQVDLVKNFAAQAVIAIENTRLLNELRESLQQQTATSDVLKVISSSLNDLKPVFDTIGQRAEKLCDAEISVISMVDDERIHLVSIHGITEEGIEAVRRVYPMQRNGETLTARAIRSASVCHVSDVLSDPLYPSKDAARASGFRGCLAVPMVREGQVIGAIFVARKQAGLFTDAQVQLLKTFADQAVIAIENVRLFNETKEALAQQTATADVLKVISRSTFDLPTVLQTLIESAARLCDADKGNITREKDGIFFRAAESYGYSREFVEHVKGMPIEKDRGSATGRALLEKRVIHIADVKADPEYTLLEGQRLGDYRTVLAVPMLREGIPLGVLTLTRSDVRPFTDKQIELVTTFADQAAIAIENVRLFDSVEARTRELAKSLEDLRTAQDRLVQTQKLASLGQLTAGIAHEIKNPLNFVNNFSGVSVELIDELQDSLKGPLDDKARAEIKELTDTLRSNLDKVVQHGKRADTIVKNMLLHSREGSSEHRLVDINALVEESLNLAYHGARAEKQGFNITLERSFDPAAEQADVFPQDITRVLLNLILNGFYAATKRKAEAGDGYEPTLTASTRSLGDRVEIKVRDNGTGIPPDVREKIFNPFFTTKPAGEGTGLGLSISHDIIVKQHGGSIEVETVPGEYTEFRIILPRTAAFVTESGAQS